MGSCRSHDLHDFMRQVGREMSDEYHRIQKRSNEDPGTAGDQGEENWANLLANWLPRSLDVVTKGRIISHEGVTSPQVDVLVLSADYPRKLRDKKHYLAAGVVAAFECKTTLKAKHITRAVETSKTIKDLYPERMGTPYRELHAPIVYGLLAHSHGWRGDGATPINNIENKIHEADRAFVTHPRVRLDVLCVADLGTWLAHAMTFIGPNQFPGRDWAPLESLYGAKGSATTGYIRHPKSQAVDFERATPIGALVSGLMRKLAWETGQCRELARYFQLVNVAGPGEGTVRTWPSSIYSDSVRRQVESGRLTNGPGWDEWHVYF